jgi:ribonucleoside-diphosphate reductase alpha chain
MIHRYAMLGILEAPAADSTAPKPTAGKLCGECGNHTMIRKEG